MLYYFLIIVMIITSILMCLIVLIQNSKGGGLASGFSSSNAIMGVRKTTDILEKATWILAAMMVLLSIATAHTLPSTKADRVDPLMEEAQKNAATNPYNTQIGTEASAAPEVATDSTAN